MNKITIITTTNRLKSLFGAYQDWKRANGFEVVLRSLEELKIPLKTPTSAQQLKKEIYKNYDKPFYLILAGSEIPTFEIKMGKHAFPQDFIYALDEKNEISAFVSRLPFSKQNEFESYLQLVMSNPVCALNNALLITGSKGYEQRTQCIEKQMKAFCQVNVFPYTAFNISELVRQMGNKQIIQYFGHGNGRFWQFTPMVAGTSEEKWQFTNDSVSAMPPAHILAWSCLTGIFGVNSLAESLMKKGALSYWGCTNESLRAFSGQASRLFIKVVSRHRSEKYPIGMLYLEVLYHIWKTETDDKIREQCYSYIFHGDPTLEIDIH